MQKTKETQKPKRMCINCRKASVNGRGLFCNLIEGVPVQIEDIRGYSCPEHKFWTETE